jgi:hypothetical protein
MSKEKHRGREVADFEAQRVLHWLVDNTLVVKKGEALVNESLHSELRDNLDALSPEDRAMAHILFDRMRRAWPGE